jgi:hypothetical protein
MAFRHLRGIELQGASRRHVSCSICFHRLKVLNSASMATTSDAKAALRRYFDKVAKSDSFSFASNRDAERFIHAILDYNNDIELLFRLASKQVCCV